MVQLNGGCIFRLHWFLFDGNQAWSQWISPSGMPYQMEVGTRWVGGKPSWALTGLRVLEAGGSSWLLVTFSLYRRAPGIPCMLPWKDSLLLPRNSGLGRTCLFIYGLKCTLGEEKWAYLFNYNSLYISVCCFFNWKFCLETDLSF